MKRLLDEKIREAIWALKQHRLALEQASRLSALTLVEEWITTYRVAQEHLLCLAELQRGIISPIAEAVARANVNIAQFASALQPYADLARTLEDARSWWFTTMGLSGPSAIVGALKTQITLICSVSDQIQQAIINLDLNAIASAFSLTEERHHQVTDAFAQMASTYNALWEELREAHSRFTQLDRLVLEVPPIELYQATNVATVLTPDAEVFPRLEEAELLLDDAADSLEAKLALLDKRLVTPYQGAKNALQTPGPDRARHFAVSMRELITHVLHMLAPDEDFQYWNTDPSLADKKGRPTRRGRLLYICRFVVEGSFANFVEADVNATLKFIDLFQPGTHAIEVPFTNDQLRAMLRRAEGLLSYLLDLGLKRGS